MDDDRKRIIGGNEAAFRKVNESLRSGKRIVAADQLFPFRCECGVLGCNRLIELTVPEYEEVRAFPTHFVIVDGHEIVATEHVLRRNERFAVVEKEDDAAAVAVDTDPRA